MNKMALATSLLVSLCAFENGAAHAQNLLAAHSVKCQLQSGDLRFGLFNPNSSGKPNSPSVLSGEGVFVIGCQNLTQAVQGTTLTLGISAVQTPMHNLTQPQATLTVAFFRDVTKSQAWGDGHNGAEPLRMEVRLSPGEHRLMHLPVHALLHGTHTAHTGAYQINVPVSLTQSVER